MNYLSENLKYLVWKSKKRPDRTWPEHIERVASACNIPLPRFQQLLNGKDTADNNEITSIKKFFTNYSADIGHVDDRPLFRKMKSRYGDEIMKENLQYLIASLERGESYKFVDEIGVNISTLTRWKSRKYRPGRTAQEQISKYFGFENEDDLKNEFLFIIQEPVSARQKKRLCKQKIDRMDDGAFNAVYQELIKLLADK